MDKSKLLDQSGALGEDRLLLAKVLDRAEQAARRNIPTATDFLSPQQQALALDLLRRAGVPERAYLRTGGYDGAERALNVYGPGSLFGEASFFDELPRVSSAVALTSCEIVAIDRELVTEEIEKDPELALAMMKYLARTVRLLSTQLDQMAFRPAQWRIARYLLSLSPTGGPVRCTQEDIASSVSASRVTVSRVLNQLARQGIIELGYSTIFVWDIEALKKTCQI